MNLITKCAIGFILFMPIVANAQNRSDSCRASSSWWDSKEGLGSGLSIEGRFQTEVGKEPIIKTFKYEGTDFIITAGVKYLYRNFSSEAPPISIELAIAVSTKEEMNVFDFVDSANASTTHSKNWTVLSVSKKIDFMQRVYTFTLVCENGKNSRKTRLRK